ncbi:MAG: hypothetical protein HKM89_09980, partial [Gemmatimonadales bacterium]|nr:hypothetical protein [Gemmatimonadales bacterium]
MPLEPEHTGSGLAVVGAVARLLRSGLGVEEALTALVSLIHERLPVNSVRIVLRRPHQASLWSAAAPPARALLPEAQSLDALSPLAPGARAFDLVENGERLGVFEADIRPGADSGTGE